MRLFFLALVLVAAAVSRAETPRVAVTGLEATGVEPALATNLFALLTSDIQALGEISVISSADIASLLGFEREKQLLGCDDASCMAELAGALGVERLVFGGIGRVGQTYVLTLTLLDARAARVLGRTSDAVTRPDDLVGVVHRAVPALFAQDPLFAGRSSARTRATWILGGSAALLAGGVAVGFLQRGAAGDLTTRFERDGVYDDALRQRASSLAAGANVLLVAGALGAALGAVQLAW